jgi:hypothetical protein
MSRTYTAAGAASPCFTRQAKASASVHPAGQAMLVPLGKIFGSLQLWQPQNKSACALFSSARGAAFLYCEQLGVCPRPSIVRMVDEDMDVFPFPVWRSTFNEDAIAITDRQGLFARGRSND